ncbi:MAG: SprT-like domain-containing protein [Gemmatimonadota bacterium]
MLRALTKLFRRTPATSQLELALTVAAPRNGDELLQRLAQLGLRQIKRLRLTHNRNVMVSFGGGALRVNEGYLNAPEPVLRAIVVFVEGRTKAERRAAKRVIITHPIEVDIARPRRERSHADDEELAQRIREWHHRLNIRHFDGQLKPVPVRVSRRMKSRLGHYSAGIPGSDEPEIAISRTHIKRHGWTEALHTLLHEMVHQWQDETGRPIDHGPQFRAKAREVGVAPHARRVLVRAPAGSRSLSGPASGHF